MNKLTPIQPEGSAEPSGLACLVTVARQHGLDLSVSQLIHDNLLANQEVTVPELLKCARSAGLKAETIHLDWAGLSHLEKALPAIIRLRHGGSMVLVRLGLEANPVQVVLQDPNAGEDALLTIDKQRFEDIWTGDVVLVKRDYSIRDEEQPFQPKLIATLIVRDWRLVRDITICALVLGLVALAPIMFWRLLMSRVIYFHSLNTFYVLCTIMLILIFFEAVFSYLRNHLVLHLAARLNVKLSTYVFERLLHLPMEFFERTPVGLITQKIGYLRNVRRFLIGHLCGTVLDSTMLLFFLPIMFLFNAWVTLVVLAVCAVIVAWLLLTLPIYRRKINTLERADGDRGSFLVQAIHGMRTIKSLVLEARQLHHYDVHVAKVERLQFDLGNTGNVIQAVVKPLERLAVSGSIAFAVFLALTSNDVVSITSLFVFILLASRVVQPLMHAAASVNEWFEAREAVDSVAELVNQPEEQGRTGRGVRTPFQGQVQFSGVTFVYRGASSAALQNVSFEVPAGTSLGIVGRSGSGKTTITRLLHRLYSDYEGLIKIDGVDVREYDLDHLRRSIGVVLQENFLFSGTIRENIATARPDATFDDVVRAARMAGAEEFIDRLQKGYDTFIYEGSSNLSGGQRQRLAIARALICDPRVLILDEATSALDPESEAIIAANLARIARGRTLIVVSHRLSSLAALDQILVLEAGRVDDMGRHEELLRRCAIYRHLWNEQNRHMGLGSTRPEKPPFRSPSLVS